MSVEPTQTVTTRVLEWLQAGYPHGVPAQDVAALLGVLHRQLTDDDIESIVMRLALKADASDSVITEGEIHRMVRDHAFQSATADDIARVSSQLAGGGWPLSSHLTD